jgi:uncharacterized protein YhjY with autotransporter beta-barrel domain
VSNAFESVCFTYVFVGENAGGSIVSSIGGSAAPGATGRGAIAERLQSVREAIEERRDDQALRAMYAVNGRQGAAIDAPTLRQPPGPPGTGVDLVFGPQDRLGVFVSAGAYAVNHDENRFEDGYEAQLPTVTAGADYRVTPWLTAGLALNYANFDGTYDNGGGFNKNIFGPQLYATVAAFQRAFIDVVLGYARHENYNKRRVGVLDFSADGTPNEIIPKPRLIGQASANYSGNQYTASLAAGYDHPVSEFTVGPRLGLYVDHRQTDGYEEQGDTGLELRYGSLDRTLIQSSVGGRIAAALETGIGVVVPQVSAVWVHEFADDSRNIRAEYVDVEPSPSFTFNREAPDANWMVIGVGASALLNNGWQAFVQFSTVQGHENFVTYGGTAGVRLSF